jgi:hypothetical protein
MMKVLEMVRLALDELGEQATHQQVYDFVRERFGNAIDPKYVPVYRATLKGQDLLRQAREQAAELARAAAEEAVAKKKRSRKAG